MRVFENTAVLRNRLEVDDAIALTKQLNLPLHIDYFKNWDSIAVFSLIKSFFRGRINEIKIMDAGGENYSVILKQLGSLGFQDLTCINLTFSTPFFQDGIKFQYGDIISTNFGDAEFDAITCLSVVEHGVELDMYFQEMARILKPGGYLFTSFDYWHSAIDTGDQIAFGVPIRIFEKKDVLSMIALAAKHKLVLLGDLDLVCEEKVVKWEEYDLEYTFMYLTMMKV